MGPQDHSALRERGALGFAAAAALLCGVAGYGLALRPFVLVAVGVGGGLLVPAWFVWMGLLLRRRDASA